MRYSFLYNLFFNKTFAVIISLIVLTIAIIIFSIVISNISVSNSFIEFETEHIDKKVEVFVNPYGIPHIIAESELSAYFAMGYMHAKDRLWQIDIMRRTILGRLSELYGKSTVDLDRFFRALEIRELANATISKMDKKTLKILTAYSEGINSFIQLNTKRLPLEFNALDYIPTEWTPADCIAISKLMAFELSVGFINDICIAEISEKVGVRQALSLVSRYPNDAPCVLDPDFNPEKIYVPTKDTAISIASSAIPELQPALTHIRNLLQDNKLINPSGASNSWVVKSNKDKPSYILANDPHLKLEIPSRWYQAQLTYPGFNAIGLTIPGLPFFLIGRNNNIAWGVTAMMNDDCDFFIERIDESNPDYYLTPTGKNKFIYKPDTIYVRNEEDIYFYLRKTERSAILSDCYIMKNPKYYLNLDLDTSISNEFYNKFLLTCSWTGQEISHEITSLYNLNHSSNWTEFSNSLKGWSSPGINWSYTDKSGNIGIKPAARIPIRNSTNPLIPNPAWLAEYLWTGYYETGDLPYSYNPTKGFVASSNNKLSRTNNIYISDYYEPASRAYRIEDIIKKQHKFSIRDVQIMQGDTYSPYARELLAYIIPLLNLNKKSLNDTEKTALQIIKNWDYLFSPVYSAPSIYQAFYKHLIYNTFHDELGEKLFRTFCYNSQFSASKILDMLKTNDTVWFDNVRTKRFDTNKDIVIKSFKDAIEELSLRFKNSNVYSWRLEKLQFLNLNHPFSQNKFLRPAVDGGQYRTAGHYTTINKSESKVYDDYFISNGVSARFITDMSDSIVYLGILGGASGDPQNPNYKNQTLYFLNGGYFTLEFSTYPAKSAKPILKIIPSK